MRYLSARVWPESLARICLLLMLAFGGSGCSKNNTPPRAQLEDHLRKLDPRLELVRLTVTERVHPDEIVEIACKARLRVREDLFESARPSFEDECQKRGLGRSYAEFGVPRSERTVLLGFEPRFAKITLLQLVQKKGFEFDMYGLVLAKRFVDRWDFSPLEQQGETPKLGKVKGDFGAGGERLVIVGTPEAEDLYRQVAAAKAERERRLDRRDEAFKQAVAPGKVYCATYRQIDRTESFPIVLKFAPAPPPHLSEMTILVANKPQHVRRYLLAAPSAVPKRQEESAAYLAAPDAQAVAELVPVSEYVMFAPGMIGNGLNRCLTLVEGLPALLDDRWEFFGVRECDPATAISASSTPSPPAVVTTRSNPSTTPPVTLATPPATATAASRTPPADPVAASSSTPKPAPSPATLALTQRAHAIFQGRAPGTKGDAILLYLQAAEGGDPDAMVNLGHIRASNRLGAKDLEAARFWYRRAAELGNQEAVLALQKLGP